MRRRTPEPPPAGPPDIQFQPGMADELLRELAPLLAEEGIDVSNIDVPDLDTLGQASDAAVAAAVLNGSDAGLTDLEKAMAAWARKVAKDPNATMPRTTPPVTSSCGAFCTYGA